MREHDTWAAVSDGGGGASAHVLIMSACRVRIATLIWSLPETNFTLGSGSPADSVHFFNLNGSLVAGSAQFQLVHIHPSF